MSPRRSSSRSDHSSFPRYVPVAERQARAAQAVKDRLKRGQQADPVVIDGRTIAKTFWGKAWCDNLEAYSDFSSRLPRGRSYARNGSIVHLDVRGGRISALVAGSELYEVSVKVAPLAASTWSDIRAYCAGHIGSLVELLGGRLSDQVMAAVSKPGSGLFPAPQEIEFSCTCPDFASLCKHTAATFFGVGARLDREPELLFSLRGVSAQELVSEAVERAAAPTSAPTGARVLGAETDLFELFGIEGEATRQDAGAGLLGGWTALVEATDGVAQRWLTLQAESLGYDDAEAAKLLGISKRRAQSVRAQAIDAVRAHQPWLDELNAMVTAAVASGTRPLAELDADPWWSGVNRAPGPNILGFLLDEVLETDAHVFEFAGRGYLTEHDEDAALDAAEGFAEHVRAPRTTLEKAVRRAVGASDPVLEALARSHLDALRRRKG